MDFHAIPKDIILKSAKFPSFFTRTFLYNPDSPLDNLTPYDYQVKVLDNPARFKVLRQGRQTGKTLEMGIISLHRLIFRNHYHIIFVAPNEHHIARFWDEKLRPLIKNSVFADTVVVDRKNPNYYMELENGSFIQGFVGNSDTIIRGPTTDMLIADECFDQYTKVITADGIKFMKDVKVGDLIMSADGTFTKVLVSKSTGIKEVFVLYTDLFETPLYVTSDHPFLFDGKWTSIKDADKIGIFIGNHQEILKPIMILAFNYLRILFKQHDEYFNIEAKQKGIDGFIKQFFPVNIPLYFKSIEPILEKLKNIGADDLKTFIRVVMRFLVIIPPHLINYFKRLGFNVKYDNLDLESSQRFVKEVGLFGDTNGFGKALVISEKMGIDATNLYRDEKYNFDKINRVVYLDKRVDSIVRRVVWNFKTESGTYMVYHDNIYIPVHNCDYISDNKWTEINGSLISRPNHEKLIGSTPSKRRGFFYRACKDKTLGFEEFHIPATMLPHWTWMKDADKLGIPVEQTSEYMYRKAFPLPGDWEREVLAEFYDVYDAVIPASAIDKAFEGYIDTSEKLGPRILGVDWNGPVHGIVFVLLEWMEKENKYRVLHTEVVSHNEYNHTVALRRILELLDQFDYDHLYVDYGYGEQDVEMLMKVGHERNIDVFKNVYRVRFNETISNPTRFGVMNYMLKEFIIGHLTEVMKMGKLLLPKSEDERVSLIPRDTLGYQLRDLSVKRITPTGHAIYEASPDHHLAALLCALYGFVNEYHPEFNPSNNSYTMHIEEYRKMGSVGMVMPVSINLYKKNIVDRSIKKEDSRKQTSGIKEVKTLDEFLKA